MASQAVSTSRRLKLTEIFHSVQGEADSIGWRTVFIRLTGCPLRCGYCDTEYSFYGGEWHDFDQIIEQIAAYNCPRICVTGGEPLAQKNCKAFIQELVDLDYDVSLETSGAIDISGIDARVSRVMDLKTPDSGEESKNKLSNLPVLTPHDQLKFVICSREDYEWSKAICAEHNLTNQTQVLFSPCHGQVAAQDLAQWVIDDQLNVRMQVQLHKVIWGEEQGR